MGKSVEAMARQPEAAGIVRGTMFIGIGIIEALALFGFVLFFTAGEQQHQQDHAHRGGSQPVQRPFGDVRWLASAKRKGRGCSVAL